MGVTQAAISKRLKAARNIQKQGNWVPHELKPKDVERRFCMSEMLLERHKKKLFFIELLLVIKNGSITTTPSAKIICETWPTSQINGKAEYPWREGNALYLVGSEGCAVL